MLIAGLSREKIGLFALAVVLLALTPGPVWVYLLSRTLAQGRRAGYFSLLGVIAGVLCHLLLASFVLSVLLLAVPFAFDAIKLAGCAYLLWLAWQTLRGGGMSFTPQPLEPAPDRVLFRQALVAAIVNPKLAVFYLSLFPQFIVHEHGSVLLQSLVLGLVHSVISTLVDGAVVTLAGFLAVWFAQRPLWLRVQRWFLGTAFGALAVWLALMPQRHGAVAVPAG
jgi:threonine/homoserine/homoserine lactone efflux protein